MSIFSFTLVYSHLEFFGDMIYGETGSLIMINCNSYLLVLINKEIIDYMGILIVN